MSWDVKMVSDVAAWLEDLMSSDPKSAKRVAAALDVLGEHGPTLGRPLVDRIEHSKLNNLKELRPMSKTDNAIRILFAFDPHRSAILLVAGNKAGSWSGWYDAAIPLAEQRFEAWINGYSIELDGW